MATRRHAMPRVTPRMLLRYIDAIFADACCYGCCHAAKMPARRLHAFATSRLLLMHAVGIATYMPPLICLPPLCLFADFFSCRLLRHCLLMHIYVDVYAADISLLHSCQFHAL